MPAGPHRHTTARSVLDERFHSIALPPVDQRAYLHVIVEAAPNFELLGARGRGVGKGVSSAPVDEEALRRDAHLPVVAKLRA